MARTPSRQLIRQVIAGLFVLALAVAGAFLGVRFAQRGRPVTAHSPARPIPTFLQASVASLPRVQVMDADHAAPRPSSELLHPQGGVLLFLDLECAPCKSAASRWQEHVHEGAIEAERVMAIAPFSLQACEEFQKKLGLEFSVYADALQRYVTEHGVDTYPWELILDGGGAVLHWTGDANAMGQLESLAILSSP